MEYSLFKIIFNFRVAHSKISMSNCMLWIEVNYLEGPDDDPLELKWTNFDVVSNGQIIEYQSIIEPEPELDISYFPGASGGGWLGWPVFPDDPDPLLAIGMDYRGRGGFYFVTHP